MTIEEKAKAYDEALKVIKDYLDALNVITETGVKIVNIQAIKDCFYRAFPELKDGGDEIRKAILELVRQSSEILDKKNQNNMIVWLEKQGTTYTKRDVDDAYLKGVTNTKNEIEKQYEANYQIRKDIATFIFNYRGYIKDRAKWMDYLGIKVSFVKGQGEQKPTNNHFTPEQACILDKHIDEFLKQKSIDKVEPKFHEGQWVAINPELRFASPLCIRDIDNNNYRVESVDGNCGTPTIDYLDNHYHLWTIQDAKDGDVLVRGEQLFLFKRMNTSNSFYAHCNYHFIGYDCLSVDDCSYSIDNIYPATKEQCDLLFQKIREAGYEWDDEKKELKKIEQKPTTWSEEDERMLDSIIIDDYAGDFPDYPTELDCELKDESEAKIKWLKSLKNRIQSH